MVEQFCHSILELETRNSKALANLIMGLSSEGRARSVVEVSLNPCYHYQHSSINKVIDTLGKKKGGGELSQLEIEKKFTSEGGVFQEGTGEFLVTEY